MNLTIDPTFTTGPWSHAALLLGDTALKGLPLLLLATITAHLLRRRSAAARHLTWSLTLAALLILPALSLLLPQWRLPLLPAQPSVTHSDPPPPSAIATAFPVETTTPTPPPPVEQRLTPINQLEPIVSSPAPTTDQPSPPTPKRPISLPQLLVLTSLTISTLLLSKLLLGLTLVSRLRRHATPLTDDSWTTLSSTLSASLHLPHPIPLLQSRDSTMPMAVGLLRPAILLPPDAHTWPPEKLRLVLLHELAHVRRRDCLTSALAHLALSLHWFNPLAWLALRRLTAERELACDDIVLTTPDAPPPSRYATCLLDIARTMHAAPLTAAAAIPMARPTQLEGRLLAILDAARPRASTTRRALALGLSLTACLLLPLAALRLSAAAPPATPADNHDDALYKPITPESHPTSDITGLVTDESHHPLPNLTVLALRGWDKNPDRLTTTTDPAGRFSFKNLAPGNWFFSVDDPHYAWTWDHENTLEIPAKPEQLPLPITLYTPRTLHATVVDDAGHPVPDVHVALVNQIAPGTNEWAKGNADVDLLATRTDPAGHFTLDRLRPGKAVLALEHPDFAVTFATAGVDAAPATLTIDKGLTVHGRVTSPDGKPLPNVSLRAGMNEAHRPTVRWRGTSDADGRFTVPHVRPMPPESRPHVMTVTVSVQDPAWSADYYQVYQTSDTELPPVTIVAKPKEPGQKPKPSAIQVGRRATPEAAAATTQAAQLGTLRVHIPSPPTGNAAVYATSPSGARIPSQIAHAGTATFEGLPPGQYLLSAVGDVDMPARLPTTVNLRPGQSLDVTLEPGPARIHGTVRSGGKPVTTGTISWSPAHPARGAVVQGDVSVHPDGSYAIDGLAPGTYRLLYTTPHTVPNPLTAQAAPDAAPFDIDLPTGRIEGKLVGVTPKVRDPDDNWHGEIFVRPRGVVPMNGNQGAWVDAAPDGSFSVDFLPPGPYTITGYGLATTTTLDHEGSVATVTLRAPDQPGQIAGTVTGHLPPAGGIMPLQVTAFPRDARGYDFGVWTYTTDVNPNTHAYRLRNLPPGTYGLFATALNSRAEFTPLVWIPNVEVRPNLSRDLPIPIPQGRMIHLDATPAGPTLQSWRLRMPTGDWLDAPVFTRNNLGGTVELPPGDYQLTATFTDHHTSTQHFTVTPAPTTQPITIHP